jgi:hypothetical protein
MNSGAQNVPTLTQISRYGIHNKPRLDQPGLLPPKTRARKLIGAAMVRVTRSR